MATHYFYSLSITYHPKMSNNRILKLSHQVQSGSYKYLIMTQSGTTKNKYM